MLEVHPKERRISLGLKQLEPNPWTTIDSRYSVGSVVEGRVRNMTDFGAFIEIEEGIDGLVHVSDLSWTKRVKHPSEILKKGQIVQAVILNIDSGVAPLVAGNQAAAAGRLGELLPEPSGGRHGSWKGLPAGEFRRVCGAGRRSGRSVPFLGGARAIRGRRGGGAAADRGRRRCDFKIIKMSEAEKKIGLSLRPWPTTRKRAGWRTISGRRRRPPLPLKR